MYSVSCC